MAPPNPADLVAEPVAGRSSESTERASRALFRAPTLEGTLVYLRPVFPEDLALLQLLDQGSPVAPRGRLRGRTPSPEIWSSSFWDGVLAQFLIIDRESDAPVGLVGVVRASLQDGHARLDATKYDEPWGSIAFYEGFEVFVEYVFSCWNFRKLYLELPEHETSSGSGGPSGFALEGRLHEHLFLGDQYWDLLIFATYRTDRHRTEGLIPAPADRQSPALSLHTLTATLGLPGQTDLGERTLEEIGLSAWQVMRLARLLAGFGVSAPDRHLAPSTRLTDVLELAAKPGPSLSER